MRSKKGDMGLGMFVALIAGVVLLVLGIAFFVKYGQEPAKETIGSYEKTATLKDCERRLDQFGKTIYGDAPITGDTAARTIRLCGFCIKKEGTRDAYYLLDSDEDGIPDACDKEDKAPPKQLKQTHREQCEGKLATAAGVTRCCVGSEMIKRYCSNE